MQNYQEELKEYRDAITEEQIEKIKASVNVKFKLCQLCKGGSPIAVRLFWSTVKGSHSGQANQ